MGRELMARRVVNGGRGASGGLENSSTRAAVMRMVVLDCQSWAMNVTVYLGSRDTVCKSCGSVWFGSVSAAAVARCHIVTLAPR